MSLTYPPQSGVDLRAGYTGPLASVAEILFPDVFEVEQGLPGDGTDYPHHETFTVEFYVYFRTLGVDADILTSVPYTGGSKSDGFLFRAGPSGLELSVDNDTIIGGALSVETWHHIAATYDRATATLTLYLDGASLGTHTNAPNLDWRDKSIRPSREDTPGDALLANLRMWDTARTSAQITEGMTTDYPASEPGLVSGYALNETTVQVLSYTGRGMAFLNRNRTLDGIEHEPNRVSLVNGPASHVSKEIAPGAPPVVYPGQISGTVTVKGDPAAQRVLAFVRSTGKKVAETTSAADGGYTLEGLNPEVAHYIVALDKNLEYNGVIADNIVPEVPA